MLNLPKQIIRINDGTADLSKPKRGSALKAKDAKVAAAQKDREAAKVKGRPKRAVSDAPIPAKTVRFVRMRDNNTCTICGLTIGEIRKDGSVVKQIHIDHVIPRAQWGDRPGDVNCESNLRCLCEQENLGKGAQAPAAWEKQPDRIVGQLQALIGKKKKGGNP